MKAKTFSVVGWANVCPHCGEATNVQPTNAGYLKCPNGCEWSYNADHDDFKEA